MWLSVNVNLISNTVGQGLAPAEFYIKFNLCFRPIFEGAVIFSRKMTEGVFTNSYKINLTIPPPHVRSAPPFTQGRLKCGCP